MDNIYDDLENYDDVNIVEELKKENAELKLKLEDYAKVMDKLQKDFNKVTTEFKNLEVNYSSLLKTARAEIERKTNIINTLNIEKDMMVLNSIQNGNRRILNLRKNVHQKICAEDTKTSHPLNNSKKLITVERKTRKIESESNVENRLPSEEIVPSPTPQNRDVKNCKNSQTNCGHKDTGENPGKYLDKKRYEKGLISSNIKNRRNSMEVTSNICPKFSSDDGSENDTSDEKMKRRSSIRDRSHNNIGHEKRHSDRSRPTTSEKRLSTHENYDERKSTYYKNRGNLYVEDYRKRDKFQTNSRQRRRISPDRYSNRRGDRDYYDDRVHRSEHNNERVSLSPTFNGRRKSRELRSNYQKDYPQHSEKKCESYLERHTTKHKISADCDEPPNKRFKTTLHCNQNNKVLERSHFVSCESPDDSAVDNVAPETPIKEIMNTAAMHLEDPRVASDKYILATESDKVVLSTVIGRNVELKSIDKVTWGYPNLPELLQTPRENSESFLKNFYLDIDNRPSLNLSLESGEILDLATNDDVNKVTVSNTVNDKQQEKPLVVIPNTENLRMSNFSEYKIPKLNVTGNNSDQSKSSCTTNLFNESAQIRIEKTSYEEQVNDEQHQEFLKHSEQQKITLSEEMVQEDLELTDEDEDSEKIGKNIKEKKKEKKHKEKKPKKSKKRTKETKTDNPDIHNSQENDLRDSKIISSENVKSKFSDLFGDSNSLITPEDLQLHSNQPRDQDAVGLLPNFEEELKDNKSLKYIPSSIDNVNNKCMLVIRKENGITNYDAKQNVDYEDNISCKQTMTDTDRQLDTTIEKLNEVKSILNETSLIKSTSEMKLSSMDIDNEQSIVKSVIISTGFQTHCGSTQGQPVETYTEGNETDNTTTNKCPLKVQESLIKALATSTPHKEIRQDAVSNVESKINSDSNVNDLIISSDSQSTLVDEFSHAKINNSQTTGDEPDIRVFARRRRRIVKKSV